MREDENGMPCPETLGEYYDLTKAIFGEDNKAIDFLQAKIDSNPNGRDDKVTAADSQMRYLIFTMGTQKT